MNDEKKPHASLALGNDPFADMDTLEWLGVESPPTPEDIIPAPEMTTAQETDVAPALDLPDDDAERALQAWLREEMPPSSADSPIENVPDAQNMLLTRLVSEHHSLREGS